MSFTKLHLSSAECMYSTDPQYPRDRVFRVSILGLVIVVLGRYRLFRYSDPYKPRLWFWSMEAHGSFS